MYSVKGPAPLPGGPVILSGHLKKLKTMKKKYFVLRGEAPGHLACLEYYDTKKKFDNRQPPKRSILLHSCFNINKRGDTKHKHVIALYTKDECFCLILDSEKELDEWLGAMLRLQSGDVPDGEQPRPTFGKFLMHFSCNFRPNEKFTRDPRAYQPSVKCHIAHDRYQWTNNVRVF